MFLNIIIGKFFINNYNSLNSIVSVILSIINSFCHIYVFNLICYRDYISIFELYLLILEMVA